MLFFYVSIHQHTLHLGIGGGTYHERRACSPPPQRTHPARSHIFLFYFLIFSARAHLCVCSCVCYQLLHASHKCTHTHTRARTQLHCLSYGHASTHTAAHTLVRTRIHTQVHTHKCTRTRMHIHKSFCVQTRVCVFAGTKKKNGSVYLSITQIFVFVTARASRRALDMLTCPP